MTPYRYYGYQIDVIRLLDGTYTADVITPDDDTIHCAVYCKRYDAALKAAQERVDDDRNEDRRGN